MHLVKKETSLIMYRALTPKRYVMWKKKNQKSKNNLLFVWMLNTFNCKRTVPLQAIITYVYAFLFESQLIVQTFFDSQPLYLSSSDCSF